MAFASHRQELLEASSRFQLDPTTSKYTPKRRPSEGQMFGHIENELTRMAKKLDQMHEIKEQQKERPTMTGTSTREKIYQHMLRGRNSFEKENTATKCQSKDDHAPTPFRDRINSYREQKKTINTFRSEKDKQQKAGRSEEETLKDYRIPPAQDCSIQTMTMLMAQNEKLAIRVGELESLCQSMSHKLGFFKAKYEQDTHRLEEAKVTETKENLYLQKLVYYYKSLSQRLGRKLIENGIEPEEFPSDSSMELHDSVE